MRRRRGQNPPGLRSDDPLRCTIVGPDGFRCGRPSVQFFTIDRVELHTRCSLHKMIDANWDRMDELTRDEAVVFQVQSE